MARVTRLVCDNCGKEVDEVKETFIAQDEPKDLLENDKELVYLDTLNVNLTQNESLIHYAWFADLATISHICNTREEFITYKSIDETPVIGVGNNITQPKGRGTIQIQSECDGKIFNLQLKDALHIPGNRNNLISLGRWDANDRKFIGHKGKITLISSKEKADARGIKVSHNLYKMQIRTKFPDKKITPHYAFIAQTSES